MLQLLGFSASNYYSLVKLALLEKGVPFEEVEVYTGAGPSYRPDYLELSPLGKVPCLKTPEGPISESRCILQYLEVAHPEPALFPTGAYARAKHDELYQVIEFYLELASRRVLPYVLSGRQAPEVIKAETRKDVEKGAAALQQLGRFEQFLTGESLRAVDLAATLHIPITSFMMKGAFGDDPLAKLDGLSDYLARMEARPHVQRIRKDTQENLPRFMAHIRAHYASAT
ncbi:MAG: glutathione S-transferase family protein [Myxococcales bacterium]|nr:glutathione S-transferase family protein [Myxococcales bacterium]